MNCNIKAEPAANFMDDDMNFNFEFDLGQANLCPQATGLPKERAYQPEAEKSLPLSNITNTWQTEAIKRETMPITVKTEYK